MEAYRNIIFDLEGTLFKTDTVFNEAFRKVRQNRGIIIGDETIDDNDVECVGNEVLESESDFNIQKGVLYEGAIGLLDKLKGEGYTLCICSNGSQQYINHVLCNFNIKDKFSIIKARIEGLSKSQMIKQILDESNCCSSIIVGDTIIDFEAADDTCCLSIGVSYGFVNDGFGNDDYEKADFLARSPSDIYCIISKINGTYREIAQQLLATKIRNKPLIVGVNGVDTSGKSIFTTELSQYLYKAGCKVQVIHQDDFHNPSSVRSQEPDPVMSYYIHAFDLRKLEHEILEPISQQGWLDKELILLDLQKDQYCNNKRYVVDHDTIVIIEGVLLYREPIDKYFDFRIYIDISFEEVIKRAIKRDSAIFGDSVVERYRSKYIPIQKLYIETCAPKDISNVVIDNEDYMQPRIIKSEVTNNTDSNHIQLIPILDQYMDEIDAMYLDSTIQKMLGVISVPDMDYYTNKDIKCYAILNQRDEFVGIVELFDISWKNRRAEFSIAIKPSDRGNGYGYEATKMILNMGFHHLGLNRIWLRVLEYNTKAIGLYEKIGFTKEGICRDESLRNGRFSNQIQMSILRREWVNIF